MSAALNAVPVLGHGCDNPLCQRIGPGHVKPSSPAQNRRAYLARRSLAGNPLGDARLIHFTAGSPRRLLI
jgi:hypothetical protein